MSLSSSSSIGTYFTGLINQLMSIERQPLNALRTQKSDLEVKRSIFSDLSSKFSALQSVVDSLQATAASSVFDKRTASISDVASGKTVLTASASSNAIEGIYNFSITSLAREHRARSDQQTYSDQALGLSGTFTVGGAAARAQITTSTIADTVTSFDVAAPASGQKEIGTGSYYVETRNDATSGWQFRIVDNDGKPVTVKQGTGSTYSANWQAIPTGGGTYDTGRGLSLTFGADSGLYQAASKGAGAAQLAYTAQGASITISAAQSLKDIASAINNAAYAEGNAVSASVVDRQLVLAAKDTGTSHSVVAADSGGTVLQSLGLLTGGGAFKNEMQTALNAAFTVNNISVTRSKNNGLDDVISGVTFNLAADAQGQTATLAVNRDSAAVRSKVDDLLTQVNGLSAYLKAKTAVTGTGSDRGSAKFSRGPLADDMAYTSLRNDLLNDLSGRVSGLPAGSPVSFAEIGITLNDTLDASVSDTTKLETALTNNPSGVKALLAAVADKLEARLNRFTNTSTGALTLSQKAVTNEIEDIDGRITSMNQSLADRESSLQEEYSVLQAQILNNLYLQQQMASFSNGFNYFA